MCLNDHIKIHGGKNIAKFMGYERVYWQKKYVPLMKEHGCIWIEGQGYNATLTTTPFLIEKFYSLNSYNTFKARHIKTPSMHTVR